LKKYYASGWIFKHTIVFGENLQLEKTWITPAF